MFHGRGPSCAQLPLAQGLITVLMHIDSAPVQELFQPGVIRGLVRKVGLQRSANRIRRENGGLAAYNHSMWGEEGRYELQTPDVKLAQGMWQVPEQFECAILHLHRALASTRELRSVCVGTWSGWTDVVLAALLRRISPSAHHATFDIVDHVSPCIKELMSRYGIKQVKHGWYGGKESWNDLGITSWDGTWPANFTTPVLDFCLIDGGHTHHLAHRDYKTLRTACRVIAFHDIVNVRVGLQHVPRLWQELISPGELYAPEFAAHNCTQQPQGSDGQLMGIGLLMHKEDILINRP
mmetsp:Transcript_60254/g.138256  ORF Transcript_60254/g.138256 Transcript_60254/m.138256 type:complete len:294 (-) Transcript_60254:215-1096(-)|eukprot:CAMPEP_0119395468 /NCGR_PEP_ID=MMETSP1334-20130426/133389_1 /TAXON_ID=127549 /ORGANISM="Calcidiscus leptoporus, Strain RCC1130" /LENGTH=293 /DNA_ID=CAMNT_0007418949 /DNA_START=91 /DNA_END=972 /DNA_ORIENTATION=+